MVWFERGKPSRVRRASVSSGHETRRTAVVHGNTSAHRHEYEFVGVGAWADVDVGGDGDGDVTVLLVGLGALVVDDDPLAMLFRILSHLLFG